MKFSSSGSRSPRDWATVPNLVTFLRLLLTIPISVLLVQGVAPVLTLVLLALFGASDWLDGYLARRLGQTSRTGAILDPVADRVGVAVIAIAYVGAGHLPLWIALLIATVDITLGMLYVIRRPQAQAPVVSVVGKVRTAILMTGLGLIGLGILPGLDVVGHIGQLFCGMGAALHLVAGVGYANALR